MTMLIKCDECGEIGDASDNHEIRVFNDKFDRLRIEFIWLDHPYHVCKKCLVKIVTDTIESAGEATWLMKVTPQ